MSAIQAIPDDACDPVALRNALRAARALPPYEVERQSSSAARDLDTTDRVVLRWRSARIEIHSLIEELAPGSNRREMGRIAGDTLQAALDDHTDQDGIDGLMGDLRDVGAYLALVSPKKPPAERVYVQARSPMTRAFSIRSPVRIPGMPTIPPSIIGDDRRVAALLGRVDSVMLVRSATMEKDVATILLQTAGDLVDVCTYDTLDRLRILSRFPDKDPEA